MQLGEISNMASKSKRDHIVALMQAGLRNKYVAKKLKVCPKAMYNTIKRYKMKGTTDSKHVPRRKRPIRTKRLVDIVRKRVKRYGRMRVRATAKEPNISETTMMRYVKDDLGLKALKMQRRQLISAPTKQKRLDRARKLLATRFSSGHLVECFSSPALIWSGGMGCGRV